MTENVSLAPIVAACAFAACGVEATPSPMDLGRYEAALVRQMNGRYSGTVSTSDGGGGCEHAGGAYSLDMASRSPFRCVYEDRDASCDYARHAYIDELEGHLVVADAAGIDTRGWLQLDVRVGSGGRDVAMVRIQLYENGVTRLRSYPDGGFPPDDGPAGFWAAVGGTCTFAITEFTATE